MIDDLIAWNADEATRTDFLRAVSRHIDRLKRTAGRGNRGEVAALEDYVSARPERSFEFDDTGGASIIGPEGRRLPAGHFETPPIAALRRHAPSRTTQRKDPGVRLWVLDGASPATDIGSLQATATRGTVFQVASQFNCLESPGACITPVARYFTDPTQGPRASISAFTGTLLRHYAAPHPDGTRFAQESDGPQINLLESVCQPEVARVRNGYLTAGDIAEPRGFAETLNARFDEIRVGVHNDVPVMLGYDWDGSVENTPLVTQVFTSTLAAGLYGTSPGEGSETYEICLRLLRAAYLGTLLAADRLGRDTAVLTLIGGGVFGNPISLIWESILWAIGEVEKTLSGPLHVVVNGRNLGQHIPIDRLTEAARLRGGAVLRFHSSDRCSVL